MSSKVVRINDDAIRAAQEYSDDLSTAILIMHAKIEELRSVNEIKALIEELGTRNPNAEAFAGIKSLIEEIRRDIPDEKTLKKTITGAVNDCFAELSRDGF